MKKMLVSSIALLVLCLMFPVSTPQVKAESGGKEDHGTVYDYDIVSVTKTGLKEITVSVQVRYCEYCNPNDASNPGCPEFMHGYPPPYYPYSYWCQGVFDGRYIAVRIKDDDGTILGTQKLVCNPLNWPIDVILARDFVFSDVPLVPGSTITAEADVYCSWCGHWYPIPMSLEIEPLKICVDPGHGGIDPGALGWDDMTKNTEKCSHCGKKCKWKYDDSADSPNEEDINLGIALALRTLLEAEDIEVIMTRTTDTGVTLQERCDTANTNECDLFVSVHCNAQKCPCCDDCENPYHTADGTETYCYPGSIEGLDLAQHIQRGLVASIGLDNRGTRTATFYVLTHTAMPAVLTEVAFLTNKNDFEYIKTHQQQAAQGIAQGIFRYFEEKGVTITAESPVDIVVTDPEGLTISKHFNEIPGATYSEIDLDGDGDPDDQIRIPNRKLGEYLIAVVPEPGALPADTYTLEVSLFGESIVIAENVPISDIPDEPYRIISTETGIIPPTIPATIDLDPNTLNAKSKGKWITAYIELPEGYSVSDVDVSTVGLSEEDNFVASAEWGDVQDSVLMVKFDRSTVIEYLDGRTGDVTLTVTGEVGVVDFKGSDTIRVISKGK